MICDIKQVEGGGVRLAGCHMIADTQTARGRDSRLGPEVLCACAVNQLLVFPPVTTIAHRRFLINDVNRWRQLLPVVRCRQPRQVPSATGHPRSHHNDDDDDRRQVVRATHATSEEGKQNRQVAGYRGRRDASCCMRWSQAIVDVRR